MNVIIVKRQDGKAYNREGKQVINCVRGCGCKTLLETGHGVCDYCLAADELQERMFRQLELALA